MIGFCPPNSRYLASSITVTHSKHECQRANNSFKFRSEIVWVHRWDLFWWKLSLWLPTVLVKVPQKIKSNFSMSISPFVGFGRCNTHLTSMGELACFLTSSRPLISSRTRPFLSRPISRAEFSHRELQRPHVAAASEAERVPHGTRWVAKCAEK